MENPGLPGNRVELVPIYDCAHATKTHEITLAGNEGGEEGGTRFSRVSSGYLGDSPSNWIAGVKISSALCAPQQVHKEPALNALRRTADCGLTEGGLSLKWNRPTCERPLELLDLVLYLVSFLFRMRSWYIFIPTIRSFLLLLLLPVRESDFWFDVKFKERKRGEKEGSCFENFRELIIIFHFYYNLNSLEILFRRDCKCYNFSNISFIY